jgi:hypothetical protein
MDRYFGVFKIGSQQKEVQRNKNASSSTTDAYKPIEQKAFYRLFALRHSATAAAF